MQRTVADEFRGRVFALYDTLFNLALVVAAVLTALVLPDNGRAPVSVVVLGVGLPAHRRGLPAAQPGRVGGHAAAAPTSA